MNRVVLKGHLGKDAVTRHFPNNGGCIVTFPLSTTEKWRDKATGEQRSKTTWHQIVVKNQHAKWVDGQLKKGMLVGVEGLLDNRTFEGNGGIKKFVTEVVVSSFQHHVDVIQKLQHYGSVPSTDNTHQQHRGSSSSQQGFHGQGRPQTNQHEQRHGQSLQNGYNSDVAY